MNIVVFFFIQFLFLLLFFFFPFLFKLEVRLENPVHLYCAPPLTFTVSLYLASCRTNTPCIILHLALGLYLLFIYLSRYIYTHIYIYISNYIYIYLCLFIFIYLLILFYFYFIFSSIPVLISLLVFLFPVQVNTTKYCFYLLYCVSLFVFSFTTPSFTNVVVCYIVPTAHETLSVMDDLTPYSDPRTPPFLV
jgi:hypothetical protein